MNWCGKFRQLTCLGSGIALLAASAALAAADKPGINRVRELLQQLGGANWKPEQVEIKKISPGIGAGGVIVEARIETAFRLDKVDGEWRVVEIRLGDRQWESFELFEEAVQREKVRRTQAQLKQLAEALGAYQRARGQYVTGQQASKLLDELAPRFVTATELVDWWGAELRYHGTTTSYRLASNGPDRRPGTKDDLIVENGELRSSTE